MPLAYFGKLERTRGCGTAGSPSHCDKEGPEGAGHSLKASLEVREASLGFGRKELKRKVGGSGGKSVNLVIDLFHDVYVQILYSIQTFSGS